MIHVCDESKKQSQEFKCERGLLLEHMKYFDKHLANQKCLDDIDISVHCDIKIFEWLMSYVQGNEPSFEVKSAVSILISSDFLQMEPLVEKSLHFLAENLQTVVNLPLDMSCINESLVKRLASIVTVNTVDDLNDRKDKLRSKLFMKKLEAHFNEHPLSRCVHCNQLFTKAQRDWQECPNARTFVDAHGQAKRYHTVDSEWDLNRFVTFLRNTKKLEWQTLYWKLVACTLTYECERCDRNFAGN